MKEIDTITAEIIRCGLATIANEMCDTMIRTATTPTFSESHDFSTSIFDGRGRMIALSDALPIHMGACKFSVMEVLKDFGDDLHPGDMIVLNDPYHGGSHIPDWTIMTPIFSGDELVLFPVTRAHQGDTGGTIPGGYNPGATDIWQEGLRLPPIKIYDKGKPRYDIIKMLQINNREPTFLGDLNAMMGSIRVGERRLLEVLKKYGVKTVQDCMNYMITYSEKRFRAEVREWPDGVYTGEACLEHDCQGVQDITVRVTVTVSGETLKLDFTGSDPQTPGFINSSIPNSYSYIFLTLSSMIDDSIPRNEGLFGPVEIILPRGSVVNPNPPAPCTACTLHIGGEIGQAVAVALAKAIPEKAYIQNIKLGMPVVTYGINPATHEFYVDQNVTMAAGWCNAAYGLDGWGALPPFFGAMTQSTGELHDMVYPVQTLGREFVTDSGGAGKWRGGLGTRMFIRACSPMFAHTYVIGTRYPMPGCNGGMDGSRNRLVLRAGQPNEMEVETTAFEVPVSAGDVYMAELGGGAGWGDPLERDPAAVLDDVIDEYVSIDAARKYYGVIIDAKAMRIDWEQTAILHAQIKKDRQERSREEKPAVPYLSRQWQELCQDAINSDAVFRKLASEMAIELTNVIENCPDGKTRFLYWRFEAGRLIKTIVGEMHESPDLRACDQIGLPVHDGQSSTFAATNGSGPAARTRGAARPLFTTIASYDTFTKINTAKMSVESAVMNGLLRFEGDLAAMMTYAEALNRFTEVRRTIPTVY
ncbi:MAG: hydantoinase B/oxoprolinase family protein [Candidatus Binatia bacterium]|jgi:N-methylhydantoinase B